MVFTVNSAVLRRCSTDARQVRVLQTRLGQVGYHVRGIDGSSAQPPNERHVLPVCSEPTPRAGWRGRGSYWQVPSDLARIVGGCDRRSAGGALSQGAASQR